SAGHFGLNAAQASFKGAAISTGGDDASASKQASLCYGGRRSRNAAGRSVSRAGTGQDLRAQAVPSGTAPAPATDGEGGVGRIDREGLERHDQIQGVPIPAARQGVRPL